MTTLYDIGDAPTVTATFRNIAGDLTNPTTVTAKMVEPDGTQTTLSTPSNTGTGVYTVTVPTFDQSGRHVVKFFGTGAIIAAEETPIDVRPTKVT